MLEIEKYLIEKDLKADDDCIADGKILVNKYFLGNKVLKDYKNCDFSIMESNKIPYEQGTEWELPDTVKLAPMGKLEFIYDENYSFNHDLVKLFMSLPFLNLGDVEFYISDYCGAPLLQIFNDKDVFVGVIMPRKRGKINE